MIKVCSPATKWGCLGSWIGMTGWGVVCDILILFCGYTAGVGTIIVINAIIVPISIILFKKYIWAARSFYIEESGIIIYSVLHREIKRYVWEDFKRIGVVRYSGNYRDRYFFIICSPYEDLDNVADRSMDVVEIDISRIDEYSGFMKYVPERMITDFPSDEMIFLLSPVKTDWLMTEEEKAEAHAKEAEERTKNDGRK